jgi:hypothetical protein
MTTNIADLKPTTLDGIKRLAKSIKRRDGCKLSVAQEVAARQAGYDSFSQARHAFMQRGRV